VLYRGAWTLRNLFKSTGYWEQVQAGTMQTRLLRDGHPSAPLAGEPYCTRSQMIAYIDAQGNEVARVHQYLRPDGTLGLSGKPDPKRVFYNGTLYILR
jgi:hypothetical protein